MLPPKEKVSLTEIDRLAGVSSATVSRAISPRTARLVKPETLEKIRKIQEKLNYRHNVLARNMRKQMTETITLAAPLDTYSNPHHSDFAIFSARNVMFFFRHILDEALNLGYDVKMTPIPNQDNLDRILERIGFPYSDGAILFGIHQLRELHESLVKRNIPNVIFSNHLIEDLPDASIVATSCEAAYADAVKFLYQQGHRKIAFALPGPINDSISDLLQGRFRAWRNAMLDVGLYDEKMLIGFEDELDIRVWLNEHHRKMPFTALFCSGDAIAARFAREVKLLGLKTPDDIAIIGHGQNPILIEREGLATIGGSNRDYARAVVNRLIGIIENTAPFKGTQVIPVSFIKGMTCQ